MCLAAAVLASAALASFAALAAPGSASTRATAPTSSTPPVISGTAAQGATLTASSGSWSGDTPISFAFRWRLCNASGAACTDISGETGQTHLVAASEVGKTLRVNVTATNTTGSATALSAQTAVVVAATAPANTAPPAITGTAQQGQTLTTSDGTWSANPTPTFRYSWERCNSSGGSCSVLGGQTAKTYVATSADLGSTLRSIVSATNTAGSATAQSNSTPVVTASGSAPRASSQPNVSGTLKVGQTLTAGLGTWTGATPISYTFVWQRCNSNGLCSTIGGATKQTYVATTSDIGHRLRTVITGRNSFGTGSVTSNLTTGAIAATGTKPTVRAAPVLSGDARQGSTLTTTVGSWTSATKVRFTYSWLRCDARGNGCAAIPAATAGSYTLTSADVGHTIRSQLTVTNSSGSTSASSNPTPVVRATPSGLIRLSDGRYSIAAANVSLPQRLIISGVAFNPHRLRSRAPFSVRFRVTDTRGYAVRDALVYVIALPYGITRPAPETPTDNAGYVTITLRPSARLPLRRGAIVLFVRARKQSDNLLAGVSTRRLVQVLVRG